MAARLLITIGSDGLTDWIKTPDGQRHSLGPVSVLNLVKKLARDGRAAMHALEAYNRDKETILNVDQDQMWELLAPRRARWAADGSFITPDQRTGLPPRKENMTTLSDDLQALEQHVSALNDAASQGVPPAKMAEGHAILAQLAGKIKSPNQSDNSVYYGLGTPPLHLVTGPQPTPTPPETKAATGVEELAYDTYATNTALADGILNQAEATNTKIDELVQAGKQFNAAKAKADLHAVTSKVAGILSDVDLAQTPWVREDLQKLAARASELHNLFAPAQV